MEIEQRIEFTGLGSKVTQFFSENEMVFSPNLTSLAFSKMLEKAYKGRCEDVNRFRVGVWKVKAPGGSSESFWNGKDFLTQESKPLHTLGSRQLLEFINPINGKVELCLPPFIEPGQEKYANPFVLQFDSFFNEFANSAPVVFYACRGTGCKTRVEATESTPLVRLRNILQ
jgi:hypothetical protein